jgi:hypothetical protein
LNFFAERDFRALRLTEWFCWYAEMSSRDISAQAFASDSFYIVRTGSEQRGTSDIVMLPSGFGGESKVFQEENFMDRHPALAMEIHGVD